MRFYVRAADRVYRNELLERVKNCARAGALATGCELTMNEFEDPYDDLMTNEALSAVMCDALKQVGVEEVRDPARSFGSLDAGNVSYVCPTIHPYFPIGTDTSVANHTREFAACTQTDFAKDNMMTAAQAMALVGYRVITEPETLKKIRDEFEAMPK